MIREKYNLNGKRVIVSRTDSIGDVVLTLPVAAVLKKLFPGCTIIFLGRTYTRDLLNGCEYIDEFADWNELKVLPKTEGLRSLNADVIIHVFPLMEIAIAAKASGIPLRVGTTSRLYHWGRINKLIFLSRKNSPYHESQLNLKLLAPFGAKPLYSIEEIRELYGLTKVKPVSSETRAMLDASKSNLLIHPGSKGSAREWKLQNFAHLIEILPADKFKLFITGTAEESTKMEKDIFERFPHVINTCGRFSLDELISFINAADGIVAMSTGPLHIAAALGRKAVGIFPPIRPMHPGRWAPVGKNAFALVTNRECSLCRKEGICKCMDEVTPEMVRDKLLETFQ
jgi:heptosyltransferase III